MWNMQSRISTSNLFLIKLSLWIVLFLFPLEIGTSCTREKYKHRSWGQFHTPEEAITQLHRFSQTYTNLSEWESRACKLRENILRGIELWSLPKKCLLNPIVHTRRSFSSYTVENADIETFGGF